MADLTKTVEIIFGGKNELTGIIGNIEKDFNKFDDTVGKIAEPLAKASDAVLKVDAALAALVVGGMALAIKESSEFNKSFALISTSVTASGDDLGKFRDDILDYSTHSVKSLQDINAALYTAAQAGVDWTNSLVFIGKAEQLAVANNANLNTTVDLLTGTMAAYGFKLEDLGHINDVFFASTLYGKQSIDELGVSMGQVLGIASGAGVSFEVLSAAIAALTKQSMGTENAITAVKAVITGIISPSAEAAKAANQLGLDFSLTALSSKDLYTFMQEVMKATGGSKEEMIKLFPEIRAMNGAFLLANEGMKYFSEAMDITTHSAGLAEEAYQKMVQTFSNQSQMLLNIAKTLLVEVGTELEPTAAKISKSIGELLKGIKIGIDDGAFDPLFEAFKDAGTELSTWISGVAKALPEALKGLDFTDLLDAFRELGSAISSYFGDLDLTNVQDLHEFIQGIIEGISGLIKVTGGMVEGFRPFFNTIVEFLKSVASSDEETQKMIGTILSLGKMIQETSLAIVLAVQAIDQYSVSVKGVFNIIAGGVQIIWNFISELANLSKMVDAVAKGFLTGDFSNVPKVFQQMRDDGQDAANGVQKIITGFDQLGGKIPETTAGLSGINKEMNASGQAGLILSGALFDVSKESTTALDANKSLGAALSGVSAQSLLASAGVDSLGYSIKDGTKAMDEAVPTYNEILAKIQALTVTSGNIPDKKIITVGVQADGSSIEKAYGMIIQKFPDGSIRIVQAQTTTSQANLDATKKKIDDSVPAVKVMEIQASIDIAKIKEASEIVQKSIEWKAKIDIADIEANAKIIEAAFKSIDNTITSTGQTLSSIVGSYGTLMAAGGSGGNAIYDEMQAESRRRDEALVMQQALTAAEISNLNARTDSMNRGDAMIQIDGSGLQPHLEAFMFEILAAIQVKANSEGMKMLVGI